MIRVLHSKQPKLTLLHSKYQYLMNLGFELSKKNETESNKAYLKAKEVIHQIKEYKLARS